MPGLLTSAAAPRHGLKATPRRRCTQSPRPHRRAKRNNPQRSKRTKRVLERAPREALQLGHQYVGTEHILLSLLAEGDGTTVQVLAGRGAGYALVRERMVAVLTGRYEQADPNTRLVRLPVRLAVPHRTVIPVS